MHDEDYSRELVSAKYAKDKTASRPQSSDAIWILEKPGRIDGGLRGGRGSEMGLAGLQMGSLSDVNLQGCYFPFRCGQEKHKRSPLILAFCSKSGGFCPLVCQEGQCTDLYFKLPWWEEQPSLPCCCTAYECLCVTCW